MDIITQSFNKLKDYCEKEEFRGWDPYDGLNSKVFRFFQFHRIKFFRLAWIQLFKRSPINFRRITLVNKGYNPKGLGLFLTGYCNLYKIEPKPEYFKKINWLANKLIELKTPGYSGVCWGYNFDWQARGGLFFPTGTPTVVATTFAAYGLLDAWEITNNKEFYDVALSSADFVLNDLNRTYKNDGSFLFSYSSISGNNTVYNASLLGSKLLARVYHYTKNEALLEVSKQSVKACINAQNEDGSWLYGELPIQNWIDSFHTGFNLESLQEYLKYTGDITDKDAIRKGTLYYLNNFFSEGGVPKYYHNRTYPIDIHCPAQLLTTLYKLNIIKQNNQLLENVLQWTIENMQSSKGYFYYQLKPKISSKISYMRWSQAWMFYSMSYYLLSKK